MRKLAVVREVAGRGKMRRGWWRRLERWTGVAEKADRREQGGRWKMKRFGGGG